MAPLRDLPGRSVRPAKSILKSPVEALRQPVQPLFPTSKKDKRRIKHAQLLSKVTKSKVSKPRRRRPSNKLVATLDTLANALPEDDGMPTKTAGGNVGDQVNIIKRKSMKSRPGALKRREKLDRGERDRFAKNLAQMATSKPAGDGTGQTIISTTSEKWAALRGFISQTLEQRPESQGVQG